MKLYAENPEQLSIIAAMLQDALVPIGDISFLEEERSFVLVLNRFRWEQQKTKKMGYERVLVGLRFDKVIKAQYRSIDRQSVGTFLSLLTIAFDGKYVDFHFSGGSGIRIKVEDLMCTMKDLNDPWPTSTRPTHQIT